MEIRNLKEEDIEELIDLIKQTEYLILERPSIYWVFYRFFKDTCFVAIDDKKIIGLLLGFMDQTNPKVSYIHELAVVKGYRRKGIGEKLIKKFGERIKQKGGNTIYITTLTENKYVIDYYKKRGFTNIKEILKVGKKRYELWKKL